MLTEGFDSAVAALAQLLGENPQQLKTRIEAGLGPSKTMLAAEMHMAGRRSDHSKALQVAYHGLYGTPASVAQQTAGWCDSKSAADAKKLAGRIDNAAKETVRGAGGGNVKLAPSFMYANSLARHDAAPAIERASNLMSMAWMGLVNRNAENHREFYRRWFGRSSSANGKVRFETVKSNYKQIHDALCQKPIMLYYRGAGAVGPNDCADGDATIAQESFFGAAYPNGAPSAKFDPRFTHIWLGNAFFQKTTVYGSDAMAGVVIHELSHAIVGTDDHPHPDNGKECYGHDLCKHIAQNYPNIAIDNADNYEFFCEEYQARGWKPPAQRDHVGKVQIPLRFRG